MVDDPNTVPLPRATSDLIHWGAPDSASWSFRRIGPAPRDGEEPRVITWTTSLATLSGRYTTETRDVQRVTNAQLTAIQRSLQQIESVANVRFRYVSHHEAVPNATLRFVRARTDDRSSFASNTNRIRDIVISNHYTDADFAYGRWASGTIMHETLHGLGLSHPGANGVSGTTGGANPLYSGEGTVMSYNREGIHGMGAYDIAALQRLYGPSRQRPVTNLTLEHLRQTTALYAPATAPMTLNITGRGNLTINLANRDRFFGRRITGTVDGHDVSAGIAHGSLLTTVRLAADSRVRLRITTAAASNITGGSEDDVFTVEGGNNILTGNGGNDRFVLNNNSGLNNVIADYNPGEDNLQIDASSNIRRGYVSLTRRNNFMVNGRATTGIMVEVRREERGPVVSSVFLAGDHDLRTVHARLAREMSDAHLAPLPPAPIPPVPPAPIPPVPPAPVPPVPPAPVPPVPPAPVPPVPPAPVPPVPPAPVPPAPVPPVPPAPVPPNPVTPPPSPNTEQTNRWTMFGAAGLGIAALIIGLVSKLEMVTALLIGGAVAGLGALGIGAYLKYHNASPDPGKAAPAPAEGNGVAKATVPGISISRDLIAGLNPATGLRYSDVPPQDQFIPTYADPVPPGINHRDH